jgi:signal transduction histidine kinase
MAAMSDRGGTEPTVAAGSRVAGQPDAWDRVTWLWHGLFIGTLAVPTLITLVDGDRDLRERLVTVAIASGLAGWHVLLVARHPLWWGERALPMAIYWVGVIVATGVLVRREPTYSILLYGQYPLMFATLGWWGLVPTVGTTAVVTWQLGAWSTGTAAVNLGATVGLSLLIALFVNAISRQNTQRRLALEALAATRAELAETARRAGVLEERARLAREIHDTVAQQFTSVVTQLEAADDALEDRPESARRHVRVARQSARDGLTEVRRSLHSMRPDLLANCSLTEALERTCRRWSTETGVPAQLHVSGPPVALYPEAEIALLRTAQEALTNVAKHAAATRVMVTISYSNDGAALDVDDDGVGFESAPALMPDHGFGIVGMRERLGAVGGTLQVKSTPGRGTTVAAWLPV